MNCHSKISVLMPVYNTKGEYLREAIESILNQTYTNFEFLILDDGSTEETTINTLNFYAKKDSRIRIIKGIHKGLGNALNKLIEESTGEYIARMDSDDISFPQRFEKQIKYLEKHPDVSILSASYTTFPKEKTVKLPEKVGYLDLFESCCIAHPCVIFRKSDFDKYDLRYNETLDVSEDYELWSRAIRFLKFANIQEPLLKYRMLNNSLSRSKKDKACLMEIRIKQSMLDFLTSNEDLKHKINNLIFAKSKLKLNFGENLFSVKNQQTAYEKRKIVTLSGFKFILNQYKLEIINR